MALTKATLIDFNSNELVLDLDVLIRVSQQIQTIRFTLRLQVQTN